MYDIDIQHHSHIGERNDLVWGLGYRVSNDSTNPGPTISFDPSGRHLALFNFFAQDEIAVAGDRLHLILGSKFENYTYSGWSVQPSARVVWTPEPHQSIWAAISRAERIPTQFDEDLRISVAGSPVLIRGDSQFQSERLTAYEIGYRLIPGSRFSLGISTYYNRYDHLRSEEGPPGGGFPITLANNLRGRTYGAEITGRYQVLSWWRLSSGYSNLQKNLTTEPGSTDITLGAQEGIDPRNQFSVRSNMDLPHRMELDFWARHVGSLRPPSGPPVPPYSVFDARVGWRPADNVSISIVGRNLPEKHHVEFGPAGELIRRSVYVTTTWRF
jgi:iron complex outermembrane receptor protein